MQVPVPNLLTIMRPNPVESDYSITKVEGHIPRELNGTLYRNAPNQKVLPKGGSGALHLFDGDGHISAITFEDGKAQFKSRYAKTPSFTREQEEGSFCLGTLGADADVALEDPPPNYQANTNAVFHGGRLYAMQETMPPFLIDPRTLESQGLWDYDGQMLGSATSAHPKIDPRTGQMIQCGYRPQAPNLQLYVIESDGNVSSAEHVDVPWASKFHEVAITENHVVIPVGAVDIDSGSHDKQDPLAGLKALRARPDLNLRFGIKDRAAGSPVRWFETPSSHYIFHTGNAFEKNSKIFMDACTFVDMEGMIENLKHLRSGHADVRSGSYLYRYEFDLDQGTCTATQLSDLLAELPRIDDRRLGYESSFGYASVGKPGAGTFRGLVKYTISGEILAEQAYLEDQFVSEPVFVPRTQDSEEDDGFILVLRYDAKDDRTGVDVLDARGIDQEPYARLWLDERTPFSVHGSWADATQLAHLGG